MTIHSPTLAIDQEVRHRLAAGERIVHLGFGEAGLPVPEALQLVLAGAAERSSYGPVAGSAAARSAAAGWFTRRGNPTSEDQVIFGPGSKSLLYALLAVIEGDVVLPCPSWVSYAAQAALLGKSVLSVPIGSEAGGVPDPDLLEAALTEARARGRSVGSIVLTVPDNPTGTVVAEGTLRRVLAIAASFDLAVIADEIYAELVHGSHMVHAADHYPERTVITTGLSKSVALGGWRIGLARVPDSPWGERLMDRLVAVASEIWSSLAAPMQAVAEFAFSDPEIVTDHVERGRLLHARLTRAMHDEFVSAGLVCRPPTAAFYLYPDFEPHRQVLAEQGVRTSDDLARVLLHDHGVATLPGSAFGEAPETLTLRVATSLLAGFDDDKRRQALASSDPAALPWVAEELGLVRSGLAALLTGGGRGRA